MIAGIFDLLKTERSAISKIASPPWKFWKLKDLQWSRRTWETPSGRAFNLIPGPGRFAFETSPRFFQEILQE